MAAAAQGERAGRVGRRAGGAAAPRLARQDRAGAAGRPPVAGGAAGLPRGAAGAPRLCAKRCERDAHAAPAVAAAPQDVEGDTLRAFVASGARVYVHEVRRARKPAASAHTPLAARACSRAASAAARVAARCALGSLTRRASQLPLPSASAPQRGKGGVLVPGAAAGGATRPLHALPARAELQGLDSAPLGGGGEALLAAVDAYGHVTLSRLRARAPAGASAASDEAYLAAATALAPRVDAVEPSWAGVAFAPGAPTTLATARHLAKTVRALDMRCRITGAVSLTPCARRRRWMSTTATCTCAASTRPPTRQPSAFCTRFPVLASFCSHL